MTVSPTLIPIVTSEVRFPPADPAPPDPRWLPIVAHAVLHRDGVFLFDTGVGTGDDEIEMWFSPRVTPKPRKVRTGCTRSFRPLPKTDSPVSPPLSTPPPHTGSAGYWPAFAG